MERRPWWDAAVGATVAVCALLVWLDEAGGARAVGAWVVLGAFLVGYAVLGRPRLGEPHRALVECYLAVMIVTVGVGVAFDGNLATLQVVAYPLIGCLAAGGLTGMLVWDVVLGAAVFTGYAAGGDGLVAGAIVAVLSLAFAMALGLWIFRVTAWGEERASLLAQVRASQERAEAAARDAGAAHERERLARDMHDTVAQSLTGIVMLVERADRQTSAGSDERALRETLGALDEAARETLREIRALVAETSAPPVEHGLAEAARRVSARFQRETGVTTSVDVDELPLDTEREVVLLRCLQEGLGNVRKHAGASRVHASLRADGGRAVLTVVDDGVGVPAGDAVRARVEDGTGFGLAGMRERVRSVGGDVVLGPANGGGAELRVSVPLASPGAIGPGVPCPGAPVRAIEGATGIASGSDGRGPHDAATAAGAPA